MTFFYRATTHNNKLDFEKLNQSDHLSSTSIVCCRKKVSLVCLIVQLYELLLLMLQLTEKNRQIHVQPMVGVVGGDIFLSLWLLLLVLFIGKNKTFNGCKTYERE